MNHKDLYKKAFGYTQGDFVACEICGKTSTEVHHIEARGMGGTTKPDFIENLMGVCRDCHDEYGDKKQWKSMLYRTHRMRMREHGVKFNEQLITELIYKYE